MRTGVYEVREDPYEFDTMEDIAIAHSSKEVVVAELASWWDDKKGSVDESAALLLIKKDGTENGFGRVGLVLFYQCADCNLDYFKDAEPSEVVLV